MSQRRMFSPDIIESPEFLAMPASTQLLYIHLCMNADDDGFVHPLQVMRMMGVTGDDNLKILIAKRFILPFETGVVVIKHWLIHNMIRIDRYKPTRYQDEKKTLFIKDNKSYTDREPVWQPNGNQMATQVRLGKVRKAVAPQLASFDLSEVREVKLDSEGNEKKPKVKRGSDLAWKLKEKLYEKLEDDTGKKPTPHIADYKQVQLALKQGLSEEDCLQMFDDALSEGKVRTVREVFTSRKIDIYRQEYL